MSTEFQKNAVDVLGLSVKGASGVTVGAGITTFFSPSMIGIYIGVIGMLVTLFLGYKKNKIYNLQIEELLKHRKSNKVE